MAERTIPQRELRNRIGEVLRDAEAGIEFTITVRGQPVARLGPLEGARTDVDRQSIERIVSVPIDGEALAEDLDRAERPIDDPWPER